MVQLPNMTYRVQFNKDFTFRDLEHLIPYLNRLGVGAIYASPIFRAVPGSGHGYDQTDPTQLNPEIGSLEQLKRVATKLAHAGIGWIQDIVPNHMAFHPENPWLWDVLEKGPESTYRTFFDTPFASPNYFSGRLMLPFLDVPLEEAIHTGRVTLSSFNQQFGLAFAGKVWPINPAGQAFIRRLNGDKLLDDPAIIRDLITLQYYEPCSWKETHHRINYRRFFTVNSLIALNVQDGSVFDAAHRLIAQLVKNGVFTGLRIDHIDGLVDPTGYLLRLRRLVGDHVLIVVEKILQPGERLPTQWPIQGTSGYDFLAMANAVLSDGSNEERLTRFYSKLTGQDQPIPPLLWQAKESQLMEAMKGELDNLSRFLQEVVLAEATLSKNHSQEMLKSALAQFIIHCPVYRWYGHAFPLTDAEVESIRKTLELAAADRPDLRKELALLEGLLVSAKKINTGPQLAHIALFYQRCMQLTGALMAKGLEDTLMYAYNRYIGANEVGGSPAEFSRSVADFHQFMEERSQYQQHTLNATATHDTKRGEDASARLQVITAFPRAWSAAVATWMKWNASFKTNGMPDANDEYFIYQTLWGTFPMPRKPLKPYRERLEAYLIKAMREAKRHTDWAAPNQTYEQSVVRFIRSILHPRAPFFKHFRPFHTEFVDLSILNSLAKVVLKFTCPGIPDCYQGSEGWDFSFVDPDNRRPVDFAERQAWQQRLHKMGAGTDVVHQLWKDRHSGQVKYSITEWLAQLRRQYPDLFQKGLYIPIAASGRYRKHVLSFIRRLNHQWLLVVVPIHIGSRMVGRTRKLEHIDWGTTRIMLPDHAPRQWRNVFTGEIKENVSQFILGQHVHPLPVSVWIATDDTQKTHRAAGVLMPLFSLPGPFGTGDLGRGAYRFVDFLGQARQRYWLMLPHHPTSAAVGYSPYSGHSAMAGNALFLDLADFARQGWLVQADLEMHELPNASEAVYDQASALKNVLFGKAFRNYLRQWVGRRDQGFEAFCKRESGWLDDYALYSVLKDRYRGKPWYSWPVAYRNRKQDALKALGTSYPYELKKVKWLQYQFLLQWNRLRQYSRQSGVQFIGDIPFYVNHDAADVWVHRGLFKLDDNGAIADMAGVPPDYFNADGQLWGMPVFRWENHASDGFAWWTQRITKNLAFYDLLRLDHFRAFYDYWEIPITAKRAKEGAWQPGPGVAPFRAFKKSVGGLPFIAEDLGDIHEGVYRLRDELSIPGMKVLQFAFGDDIATNLHAPHHHSARDVVFTGTHDNDTAVGWYRNESTAAKARLSAYAGAGTLTPQRAVVTLCRLAYASPARLAIIPLQDLLGLGTEARMNIPAVPTGNWRWRLDPDQLTTRLRRQLSEWVQLYGR
ncbi:MAG TPA: malto-oligosyltrehalose synthase [Parapedobacter sp.]|uniref:malto-oligosyltrehalose synthase n=1 Tax=Parapedobacter sp. TaxID=1958893 RepID=UPI002BEAD8D4|nr:malto-oligosyltrehalose synthase [Parapedobacter sp.]HWK58394.1 malto-oligosyltrehalose synthase [Parapedobacter sp.]